MAIGLRARLPLVMRVLALGLLVAGLIVVGISYYRQRNNTPFRMLGGKPELSTQVVGVVEGYERRIMEGDRLRLYVRAAKDTTFTDNHHEMEDVQLEAYPAAGGDKPDKITAQRAIYIPDQTDPNQASVTFSGNVNIETRDALKAQTDSIVYDQKSEVAETASLITFTRENVSGQSNGAQVDAKNKKLELRSNVQITIAPDVPKEAGGKPNPRAQPVIIHAAQSTFDQHSLHLNFTGGATAEQGADIMSGDKLLTTLNAKKRLQKLEVRGNSYLRSMEEGRSAEIHSRDMDFFLDDDQKLERAMANGDVRARSLNADSEMQLSGSTGLETLFQRQGEKSLLKEMKAAGRTVITLSAPQSRANDPRAAGKQLTADYVHLNWRTTGRDLERAEAVGNAELIIDPVQKSATADRRTLTAPRFDCDFFETGNLARTFTATGGAKAVIDPVQPTPDRGVRTLTSEKMAAVFVRETQDVERFDAQGDAKFNELDRNGHAANVSYTSGDETVRLRGGEPTVWDSRARIKATEIDMDTRNDVSNARVKTQTTYYSQEQTGGATPFSKVKSPVYITADRAEFEHNTGVAVYTGSARAWQDDNFVRADKLTLRRESKSMQGDGHVQSALYNVKRHEAGQTSTVPAFATAERMTYSDTDRLLHYEINVDIRQGTDRLTGGVADVYLLKETNEVEKTIAQRDVVLTQPGRKGTGQWAQYTNADETVVLTGTPARVEDAEQGSSEGGRLTVHLRDSRVEADDPRGTQSSGRVRSTHRIKRP
ncbi:MAG: LPS export ABC transporter periplasmic protein LptC [Acidobacteria bacterium]|nr:LPS export ABC transporter periplasmic protein LptC [Acidobacteriota bacterium]